MVAAHPVTKHRQPRPRKRCAKARRPRRAGVRAPGWLHCCVYRETMDPQRVRRIVVATDLSERATAVLETAVTFGRMFDASLDLVHVREPFEYTLTEGFVA